MKENNILGIVYLFIGVIATIIGAYTHNSDLLNGSFASYVIANIYFKK